MRRVLRWFRVVAPSTTLFAFLILPYLACEGIRYYMAWQIGAMQPLGQMMQVRDIQVIFAACFYGMYRVTTFHPLFNQQYLDWLRATPWRSGKRLPFGPIALVPQDIIIVGLLTLLLYDSPRIWLVPTVFLFTYLVQLTITFAITDTWRAGYTLAYGLAFVPLLWGSPLLVLVALVLMLVPAFFGLRESLEGFPWEDVRRMEEYRKHLTGVKPSQTPDLLGWPYEHLPPRTPQTSVRVRDGILGSLLSGWWTYALISTGSAFFESILAFGYFFVVLACVFGRLGVYCNHCKPPITFWGRLRLGKFIIPRHDRVYAAPLLALAIGIIGPLVGFVEGIPLIATLPIWMTLVPLVTMLTRPSLAEWLLTGAHRLIPGYNKARQDLIEL